MHDPWLEPLEPDAWFERLLERNRGDTNRSLFVRRAEDDAIVGAYNISQIFMGPLRSAYLGYYAFEPFAGQGYMREAMPLLLRLAFEDLGLHRLQANVQPENARSIALLRAMGFTEEGLARRYLKIRGRWRDHSMFAMLAEDRSRAMASDSGRAGLA